MFLSQQIENDVGIQVGGEIQDDLQHENKLLKIHSSFVISHMFLRSCLIFRNVKIIEKSGVTIASGAQ